MNLSRCCHDLFKDGLGDPLSFVGHGSFSVDSSLVSAVSLMGFVGIIIVICAALYHF